MQWLSFQKAQKRRKQGFTPAFNTHTLPILLPRSTTNGLSLRQVKCTKKNTTTQAILLMYYFLLKYD